MLKHFSRGRWSVADRSLTGFINTLALKSLAIDRRLVDDWLAQRWPKIRITAAKQKVELLSEFIHPILMMNLGSPQDKWAGNVRCGTCKLRARRFQQKHKDYWQEKTAIHVHHHSLACSVLLFFCCQRSNFILYYHDNLHRNYFIIFNIFFKEWRFSFNLPPVAVQLQKVAEK